MSQHARYLIGLAVEALIFAAVVAAIVGILVTRRRERRQDKAYRDEQRARGNAMLAADLRATPATAAVEHEGATATWSPTAELARIKQIVAHDAPVEHEGATEAYGAELRAAGQALPSADLRTTGEQMVADHHELAGISDGLDRFSENVMHELRLFLRDDAEYARVARWAPSSTEDTCTFPVVRAELAGAGAR